MPCGTTDSTSLPTGRTVTNVSARHHFLGVCSSRRRCFPAKDEASRPLTCQNCWMEVLKVHSGRFAYGQVSEEPLERGAKRCSPWWRVIKHNLRLRLFAKILARARSNKGIHAHPSKITVTFSCPCFYDYYRGILILTTNRVSLRSSRHTFKAPERLLINTLPRILPILFLQDPKLQKAFPHAVSLTNVPSTHLQSIQV